LAFSDSLISTHLQYNHKPTSNPPFGNGEQSLQQGIFYGFCPDRSACISLSLRQIVIAVYGTNCLPISPINMFSQKIINYMNQPGGKIFPGAKVFRFLTYISFHNAS